MKAIGRRAVIAAGLGGALTIGGFPENRPQIRRAATILDDGPNPIVPEEPRPLQDLRRQLNQAARGKGKFEKDEAGRSIVVAPSGTHVLLRTLIIARTRR